jgi:hypothetical protein
MTEADRPAHLAGSAGNIHELAVVLTGLRTTIHRYLARRDTTPTAPNVVQFGISCIAAGTCTSVGQEPALTFNGTEWNAHPVAKPTAAATFNMTGDSCYTGNHCEAVGYYTNSTGTIYSPLEGD